MVVLGRQCTKVIRSRLIIEVSVHISFSVMKVSGQHMTSTPQEMSEVDGDEGLT
jgi:hypothetical protein